MMEKETYRFIDIEISAEVEDNKLKDDPIYKPIRKKERTIVPDVSIETMKSSWCI